MRDGLSVEDVLESILNANAITKILRARSQRRWTASERLYVVEGPTFDGTWIYTIRRKGGAEAFYVFISSKLAERIFGLEASRRFDAAILPRRRVAAGR